MFCTMSNKHTKITRIKQKYSNDNQKARRKIIELQPQNFIYSFQVKLNKTPAQALTPPAEKIGKSLTYV